MQHDAADRRHPQRPRVHVSPAEVEGDLGAKVLVHVARHVGRPRAHPGDRAEAGELGEQSVSLVLIVQLDQFLHSFRSDELLEIEAGAAPLARRDLIVLLKVFGSQNGEEKALAKA